MQPVRNVSLFLLAASLLAAADAPYMGKWKLNPAKSDFGSTTLTFTQTASGEMQFTVDGMSYTFKTDGKEYPALFGTTSAWKAIDANTWETTDRINGKVLSVETDKLSAEGKTLTVESKGTKPDGTSFDDVSVYQRVSGGPGIGGKWKTKNLKISSPSTVEFGPNGTDGLSFSVIDQKMFSKAKFDGKDYPVTGETFGAGWTMALKKGAAGSFEMTVKQDGKPRYMSTYTVSADGKTLTESGSPVGVDEKYKAVYDRQ